MSDSEHSSNEAPVSDARLENALRNAVEKTYKRDPEQLTVKRLRSKVEQELGLGDGFFKSNATWNARSKEVIQSEVAAQEAQSQPPSSQPDPTPIPTKAQKQLDKDANGRKRPSTGDEGSAKRRKKSKPEPEVSFVENHGGRTENGRSASSTSLSDVNDTDQKQPGSREHTAKAFHNAPQQDSESELSSLIDEDPKPKKRGRKSSSEQPKTKKKESSKPAKATQQSSDPDAEEIKRLQGWLVKCGIRKMWFKELAPYDSAKAKIRHLKDMLTDAGMTGRYSQEKATQIREDRELKADLEAVKAGDKQWGKGESDEEEGGRPRRRIARGLQELDFLNDDDGDESD